MFGWATAAHAAPSPPTPRARTPWLARCDAVVRATLASPSTRQQRLAIDGVAPFVRMQWRLDGATAVTTRGERGRALARALARAPVLVDEAAWRHDLATWRRCKGEIGCVADTPTPAGLSYASALARPPRAGDAVVALLVHTPDGPALAAIRGFDAPTRAAAAAAACAAARPTAAEPAPARRR